MVYLSKNLPNELVCRLKNNVDKIYKYVNDFYYL